MQPTKTVSLSSGIAFKTHEFVGICVVTIVALAILTTGAWLTHRLPVGGGAALGIGGSLLLLDGAWVLYRLLAPKPSPPKPTPQPPPTPEPTPLKKPSLKEDVLKSRQGKLLMMILPKSLPCAITHEKRLIAIRRDPQNRLQVGEDVEGLPLLDKKLETILGMQRREYYAIQLTRSGGTDLCWIITCDEKGKLATYYWGLNNDQADRKIHSLWERQYWNSKWQYKIIFDGEITPKMHHDFRDHFFKLWDSFPKNHYWICHDFTITRDDKGVTKVDFRTERSTPSQMIPYETTPHPMSYERGLFGEELW